MVKGLLKYSFYLLAFSLLVTPLFAKTHSVTISQAVTVGSTQIPAGDYKVSWDGTGPMVKVTLARSGASPVVLDAKLVTQKNALTESSIVTASQNGALVLQEIQLKSTSLLFEDGEIAQK